jgi:hypothetical protein
MRAGWDEPDAALRVSVSVQLAGVASTTTSTREFDLGDAAGAAKVTGDEQTATATAIAASKLSFAGGQSSNARSIPLIPSTNQSTKKRPRFSCGAPAQIWVAGRRNPGLATQMMTEL